MVFLSINQQNSIITELGFIREPNLVIDYLLVDFYQVTVDRITFILERLEEIENFRRENIGDSMATKVGSIELSYNQHYQRLYIEAWNLLNELASIVLPTHLDFTNKYQAFLGSSNPSVHLDFK